MNTSDILTLRLQNQLLTHSVFSSPKEVIAWFGAVQAQDFTGAKWAIGLRSRDLIDEQIEDAFNQGRILRTHVMRPTWHFVLPKDIRWMLALTKTRVHMLNNYYYKQSGLDKATLDTATEIIKESLRGNRYVTREELGKRLHKKFNITTDINVTIGLMLMYAELEAVVCSGPKRGKQFTYALLDERVPQEKLMDAEESLAELTIRYFQSHGPATLRDFVWWSGLTTRDAEKGIELSASNLNRIKIGELVYWYVIVENIKRGESKAYLLPNYDEYIVGYKNREFIFDSIHTTKLDSRVNPLFQHTIVLDGKIVGTWKREFTKNAVIINTTLFEPMNKPTDESLKQASAQFGLFVNKPVSSERK